MVNYSNYLTAVRLVRDAEDSNNHARTEAQATPDVDKVEHDTEGLSDFHVALQRALPRVHAPVVCSGVSQTGHIDQKKRRRLPSTLVYGIVVEMLETKGGGCSMEEAFLRRRG